VEVVGEQTNHFPLPGIEMQFLGREAISLVIIMKAALAPFISKISYFFESLFELIHSASSDQIFLFASYVLFKDRIFNLFCRCILIAGSIQLRS
jgi:hypothetical protein